MTPARLALLSLVVILSACEPEPPITGDPDAGGGGRCDQPEGCGIPTPPTDAGVLVKYPVTVRVVNTRTAPMQFQSALYDNVTSVVLVSTGYTTIGPGETVELPPYNAAAGIQVGASLRARNVDGTFFDLKGTKFTMTTGITTTHTISDAGVTSEWI